MCLQCYYAALIVATRTLQCVSGNTVFQLCGSFLTSLPFMASSLCSFQCCRMRLCPDDLSQDSNFRKAETAIEKSSRRGLLKSFTSTTPSLITNTHTEYTRQRRILSYFLRFWQWKYFCSRTALSTLSVLLQQLSMKLYLLLLYLSRTLENNIM